MIRIYLQQGKVLDDTVVYKAHGLIPGQDVIVTLVDEIRTDGKGTVNWVVSRRGDGMSIRRLDMVGDTSADGV